MYKIPIYQRSSLKSVPLVEGETIEQKVERVMTNKEPIKDGAPLIFTERKDGVLAGYNIRTDRWEVATEAMDLVHKQKQAKRDGKAKTAEMKAEKGGGASEEDGGTESTQASDQK